MTATTKPRHLRPVPDPRRAQDVVELHAAAAKLAERQEQINYQRRHARQAAAMPDVVKDRDVLVTKTLHRLKMAGADQRALLVAFADAMFIAGYMDDAGTPRTPLEHATLGTLIQLDQIERKVRDSLANQYAKPGKGDPT